MNDNHHLPEFIHGRMNILFLALSTPELPYTGHYFSENKVFWNLLYKSNLITRKITNPVEADTLVFGGTSINFRNAVFGITDFERTIIQPDAQP